MEPVTAQILIPVTASLPYFQQLLIFKIASERGTSLKQTRKRRLLKFHSSILQSAREHVNQCLFRKLVTRVYIHSVVTQLPEISEASQATFSLTFFLLNIITIFMPRSITQLINELHICSSTMQGKIEMFRETSYSYFLKNSLL